MLVNFQRLTGSRQSCCSHSGCEQGTRAKMDACVAIIAVETAYLPVQVRSFDRDGVE